MNARPSRYGVAGVPYSVALATSLKLQRSEAKRLALLVDTLYEARARLVVLAAGEPDTLYPVGDHAFEFERTASRLKEMRSAEWVAATGG